MSESRHPLAMLRSRAGGISQLELAQRVGVTPGMVSQWERNAATPRRELAAKVDEALDAEGEALEAFGYLPPGTIRRLAAVEERGEALARLVGLLVETVIDQLDPSDELTATLGGLWQALVPPPAPGA